MNESISHLSHSSSSSSSSNFHQFIRGAPEQKWFEKLEHLQTKLAGTTQAGKKSTKNKRNDYK